MSPITKSVILLGSEFCGRMMCCLFSVGSMRHEGGGMKGTSFGIHLYTVPGNEHSKRVGRGVERRWLRTHQKFQERQKGRS